MVTINLWLWSGSGGQVIEGVKSCHLEVKATESDKWLQSYGHLKITITIGSRMYTLLSQNPKIFWGRAPSSPLIKGVHVSPLPL